MVVLIFVIFKKKKGKQLIYWCFLHVLQLQSIDWLFALCFPSLCQSESNGGRAKLPKGLATSQNKVKVKY